MRRRPETGEEMHGYGSQGQGGDSGGGYYSAPTDRIRETNHNIMEMQNNAHIDDLSDQVSTESSLKFLLIPYRIVPGTRYRQTKYKYFVVILAVSGRCRIGS